MLHPLVSLRRTLILFALLPAGAVAQAPVPGECELGRAENDIDVGDVFARVFNTGSLFLGNSTEAGYVVPRGSGLGPFYHASLWVGGDVGGMFRVAASYYSPWEFWPGPLHQGPELPDAEDCSAFDRIWKVSRLDLERYYGTGTASPDMLEWPHHLGAPVIDGDGNPNNYDLGAGDQPAVSGDQTLWWVMNDLGNAHRQTESEPMGLEVQVTAFGFGSGPAALRQATFYRYRLINRNDIPLEEAYVGFYSDFTPGCSLDDYMATDTLRSMIYAYGGDDADGYPGSPVPCYPAPPAAGLLLQQGPVALPNSRDDDRDGDIDESGERHRMTASYGMTNGVAWPLGGPVSAPHFYHAFRGRWSDGTPITEGGHGYMSGGPVTTFMFPGDPVTSQFWSEIRPTPNGPPNPPYYRHVYLTSGPFRLEPGQADEILLVMPFAQGVDRFDSIVALRRGVAVIGNAYEAGYLDPRPVPGFAGPPAPPAAVQIRRPAPNPFDERATIGVSLPSSATLRITLVDVLGREVAVLADGPREAGPHVVPIDGAALPAGVYLARVWVNGQPAAALPFTRR